MTAHGAPGPGEGARATLLADLARQLGVIASRRVSVSVGLQGAPGSGKTHTARAVLTRLPYPHLSAPAPLAGPQLAHLIPRARTLPAWAGAQLDRLARGEALEARVLAQTLAAALAALGPIALHLEDLHDADVERTEAIGALARAVARTRGVGLLVTSRAELPEPLRAHTLAPLDERETAWLVQQELRGVPPPEALAYLHARTRGNPLFALEFARYLRRHGFLWSDGERWQWRPPPEGFVPVTVEALIGHLTGSVADTPQARAVLAARALLPGEGHPQLEALWATVAQVAPTDLQRERARLERAGVLAGGHFAHPLFAELTRRDLPGAVRAGYAGRALHALLGFDPLRAAEYVQDARLPPREATGILERAARHLQARGDPVGAARWLARAADHAGGEARAALSLEAARLLRDHDLRECERLARTAMTDARHRHDATLLCATALRRDGRTDEAWSLLEALPDAQRDGLEWWALRLQFLNAHGHDRVAHNREALRLWDAHPDFQPRAPAGALRAALRALIDLGEGARAEAVIEGAVARVDLSAAERATILDRRNALLYRAARYEDVERNLTAIIESVDEREHPWDCVAYLANRSNARTRLGRRQDAKADAQRASALALSVGSLRQFVGIQTALALAHIYLQEYPEAERVLLDATALAPTHHPDRLCECYGHLSFLYLHWDPPHGSMLARRYARLALDAARETGRDDALASALEDCCRAEVAGGAPERALTHAQELAEVAARTGLAEDETACAYHLGRVHAELGQRERALPHLRRAVALYEAHGNPAEALGAALEIDRLEGHVEDARRKLEWFEAHGEARRAAQVRRYFPALAPGVPAPPVTPADAPRLEVLGPVLLARGGTRLPSRAHKRLELLAYLLETRVAGRDEASTLELLDALYPEAPELEARNTLKQQVYLIRSGLGADSVRSTPTGYALGHVTSDAEDFLRSNDAALWRGAYLGGLTDGWRAGVRDALTHALRAKVEALLEPDAAEAARLAAILCEMEPYDVTALQLVTRALSASAGARAATRAYQEGRARLQELGARLPESLPEFLTGPALA